MLCLSPTLQRGPQKPALCVVWQRLHCSHYHSQNSHPTIKLYSFHLFLKKTRLMQSCWVCACVCPSMYLPSNFWPSAWLWSLLAEGQRPWQHQAHENCQENERLVWSKENILTVPEQKKLPSSPFDSKGSNMSCKNKRNKALPVLRFVEASWHSSKRHHKLWLSTRYPGPQNTTLPWAKGLNSLWPMQLPHSSYYSKEREKHHISHLYHHWWPQHAS